MARSPVFLRVRVDGFWLIDAVGSQAEDDRHAVGDAAVDAAVVVGPGLDDIAIVIKGVVGLGAAEVSQGEAVSPNSMPLTAGTENIM